MNNTTTITDIQITQSILIYSFGSKQHILLTKVFLDRLLYFYRSQKGVASSDKWEAGCSRWSDKENLFWFVSVDKGSYFHASKNKF
jgi:hypothetical protein